MEFKIENAVLGGGTLPRVELSGLCDVNLLCGDRATEVQDRLLWALNEGRASGYASISMLWGEERYELAVAGDEGVRAETVWVNGRCTTGNLPKIPNTANCFDNSKQAMADKGLTDPEVTLRNYKEFFRLLCEDTEKGDRRPIFIAGLLECLPSGDEVRRVIAELLSLSRQLFFATPRDLWPEALSVKKFFVPAADWFL